MRTIRKSPDTRLDRLKRRMSSINIETIAQEWRLKENALKAKENRNAVNKVLGPNGD